MSKALKKVKGKLDFKKIFFFTISLLNLLSITFVFFFFNNKIENLSLKTLYSLPKTSSAEPINYDSEANSITKTNAQENNSLRSENINELAVENLTQKIDSLNYKNGSLNEQVARIDEYLKNKASKEHIVAERLAEQLREGMKYIEEKRYLIAKDYFYELSSNTDSPLAQTYYAYCLLLLNGNDSKTQEEAIRYLNRAVWNDENNDFGYYLLGKAYQLKGELSNAEANYKKAISLNSAELEYIRSLAAFYFLKAEYEKALREYENIREIEEKAGIANQSTYYFITLCQYNLKNYSMALENILVCINIDENYWQARLAAGDIYSSLGEYIQANSQYEECLKYYVDHRIYNKMAENAYCLNAYDTAVSYWLNAIKLLNDANQAEYRQKYRYFSRIAYLYWELGLWSKSCEYGKMVFNNFPEDEQNAKILTDAYEKKGDLKGAEKVYLKNLELGRENAEYELLAFYYRNKEGIKIVRYFKDNGIKRPELVSEIVVAAFFDEKLYGEIIDLFQTKKELFASVICKLYLVKSYLLAKDKGRAQEILGQIQEEEIPQGYEALWEEIKAEVFNN